MSSPVSTSNILSSLQRRGFWFLLLRGIFAILIGILLIISPFASAAVFGIIVGAWMIVDGLSTIGLSVDLKKNNARWGWVLTDGIIQVIAGIAIIIFPVSFAIVSTFFIIGFMAIGMIASGIIQLSAPVITRTGWSIAVAIIDIIFGVLLGVLAFVNPVDNVVALSWLAGVSAIFLGLALIIFSVKVREFGK